MRRGEIWTAAGGAEYAGKPRPVAIVQADEFDSTASIAICPFTTAAIGAELLRLPVEPSEHNGLKSPCRLMADKIMTISRSKMGMRIGRLEDEHILRLNQALAVFLGLGAAPRTGAKSP